MNVLSCSWDLSPFAISSIDIDFFESSAAFGFLSVVTCSPSFSSSFASYFPSVSASFFFNFSATLFSSSSTSLTVSNAFSFYSYYYRFFSASFLAFLAYFPPSSEKSNLCSIPFSSFLRVRCMLNHESWTADYED